MTAPKSFNERGRADLGLEQRGSFAPDLVHDRMAEEGHFTLAELELPVHQIEPMTAVRKYHTWRVKVKSAQVGVLNVLMYRERSTE